MEGWLRLGAALSRLATEDMPRTWAGFVKKVSVESSEVYERVGATAFECGWRFPRRCRMVFELPRAHTLALRASQRVDSTVRPEPSAGDPSYRGLRNNSGGGSEL